MFERRVRIVLVVMVLACAALLVRAAQVQISQGDHWEQVAEDSMRRSRYTDAPRGSILDVRGNPIAEDVPCNDAAVAYWFITDPPDETRLYGVAREIARATPGYFDLSRGEQHDLVTSLLPEATERLERMWEILAEVGGVPRAEIEATRQAIVDRVEQRRRWVVYLRHREALADYDTAGESPWWRRWILGEADAPPEMEKFEEPIADETQAHVILPDISNEAYNRLRKLEQEMPGLVLTTSTTRSYPFGNATSHVVGFMAKVTQEDLVDDPEGTDELRAYLSNDSKGADGLEAMAERRLRGTRGRIDLDLANGGTEEAVTNRPGQDVRSTLDMGLQQDIRNAFLDVEWRWPREGEATPPGPVYGPSPGAAVVIDVESGAIRSLVSYPDFDPNAYYDEFGQLMIDEINRPLMNRATSYSAVPGSTVKPIVGLAAITEGLLGAHETIECDGYLHINGKAYTRSFRCWTMAMYDFGHHQNVRDPHPTPGLNPVDPPIGHLTLADALQRSCNVYFETVAARLGNERLDKWFKAFGLGEPLEIGLGERGGILLEDLPESQKNNQSHTWYAGIGQGYVQATPLQMANVAATLARRGIFVTPSILESQTKEHLRRQRNLHLDADAIDSVFTGMEAVVSTAGGSGHDIEKNLPLDIAGKTGSANAHALKVTVRGFDGTPVTDLNGRQIRETLALSTRGNPNPQAPWYRRVNAVGEKEARQSHGWFIGWAPANDPQIAFAVFVEYGGSGGTSAGSVVPKLIDACVRHGYLTPTREPDPQAAPGELLYVVD